MLWPQTDFRVTLALWTSDIFPLNLSLLSCKMGWNVGPSLSGYWGDPVKSNEAWPGGSPRSVFTMTDPEYRCSDVSFLFPFLGCHSDTIARRQRRGGRYRQKAGRRSGQSPGPMRCPGMLSFRLPALGS